MNTNFVTTATTEKPLAMNPLKFAMWLFIVSIVMIFASLTSAYIVRRAEGNWVEFYLPNLFYVSSIIIIISSITIQYALAMARKDNFVSLKWFMAITAILGLVFMVTQFLGWQQMVEGGIYFVGNPSGSFVYVISGLHAAHVIAGVVFVLIVLWLVFKDKVHSKQLLWIEICTTFWHFLDGLWLYLFFFLILNR